MIKRRLLKPDPMPEAACYRRASGISRLARSPPLIMGLADRVEVGSIAQPGLCNR